MTTAVIGATGRVGSEIVRVSATLTKAALGIDAGHHDSSFLGTLSTRRCAKIPPSCMAVCGDTAISVHQDEHAVHQVNHLIGHISKGRALRIT
jgi:dihydrodipicolinate reductase